MKRTVFGTIGALMMFGLIPLSLTAGSSQGTRYLFPDKQFHYQAIRTLGHAPYGGALPGEVMSLIARIDSDESWEREWSAMAERCETMAKEATDPVSGGNAFLRASNYYRAAEFFIPPSGNGLDAKKVLYRKSADSFRKAMTSLGVNHRIYRVPYESGFMTVYYFPGRPGLPVMFLSGGFDCTSEEIYFFTGAALMARGYPVVIFDGPGQSGMIRDYGIRFTPDWHKPVGKVMDFVLSKEPDLAARKKVLFGISMGGILVGRAAAFENRLDGVILFGAPYDMKDAALHQMPSAGRWLYSRGMSGTINTAVNLKKKWDRNLRWGVDNGTWTIGGGTPYDMINAFGAYTLKDVEDKVRCHVLCIYGEKDIYVSDGRQLDLLRNSFGNAASFTMKVFREEDGSAEHCQAGSTEQAVQAMVTWMQGAGLDRE